MKIENMRALDLTDVPCNKVVTKCHSFLKQNDGHDMYIITGDSKDKTRIVCKVIDEHQFRYLVGGPTGTYGFITVWRRKHV